MGRYAYLIMVSEQNNNKFYSLCEQDDGTIEIYNGRVDVSKIRQEPKPISQFDKIYNSKIKKGYVDVTHLVATTISKKSSVNYVDIDNKEVKDVIEKLIAYSKKTVEDNYKVKASSVTKQQVDEAQKIIDSIAKLIRKGSEVKEINAKLIELFTVIPRKMKKVQDYLLEGDIIKDKTDLENANHLISKEQDILDSMGSSVVMNDADEEIESGDVENRTILDTLGITMSVASDEDVKNIKNHLGEIKDKFRRAFVVTHKESKEKFDKFVEKSDNKKVELLFHGSRNENWVSILRTSLLIRPAGVVVTGSMFGSSCVYMASKALKSFGYTSGRGSRWVNGNSNVAYMAIFKCHVGKQWIIHEHQSYCNYLDEKTVKEKGFDSVWAKAGKSLYNDEFMFYNPNQVTIKYLVELDG